MILSPRGLSAIFVAFSLLAGCQLSNTPGDTHAEPTPTPSVTLLERLGGDGLLGGSLLEQPHLEVVGTLSSSWIWDDRGTGAKKDVSIWRPQGPSDYAFIGDFAHGSHAKPTFTYNYEYLGPTVLNPLILVKAVNEDPANPLLKAPVDYELAWDSKRTGARADGSIWIPVAPPGYVTIGAVATTGYEKPSLETYRCVREDLCERKDYGDLIWDDIGSGARRDVVLFGTPAVREGFIASPNHTRPVLGWVLKRSTETHGVDY